VAGDTTGRRGRGSECWWAVPSLALLLGLWTTLYALKERGASKGGRLACHPLAWRGNDRSSTIHLCALIPIRTDSGGRCNLDPASLGSTSDYASNQGGEFVPTDVGQQQLRDLLALESIFVTFNWFGFGSVLGRCTPLLDHIVGVPALVQSLLFLK
jgi:hypothetical protein